MKTKLYSAVEFPDDPNVVGRIYWYACPLEGAKVGSRVVAPLGSHNHLQTGVIRGLLITDGYYSPYPDDRIKSLVAFADNII